MRVDEADSTQEIELFRDFSAWRMAGHGSFAAVADGIIESVGGPGLYWFTGTTFGDFVLDIDWRIRDRHDNSGVFIRFPALGAADPDSDWRLAVTQGYEIQTDDRGLDPAPNATGSMLHISGAIYRIAPASRLASRPVGAWNHFRVTAHGIDIGVSLNGVEVARSGEDVGRPRRGHIGLQNHHDGSRVQFRNLRIRSVV